MDRSKNTKIKYNFLCSRENFFLRLIAINCETSYLSTTDRAFFAITFPFESERTRVHLTNRTDELRRRARGMILRRRHTWCRAGVMLDSAAARRLCSNAVSLLQLAPQAFTHRPEAIGDQLPQRIREADVSVVAASFHSFDKTFDESYCVDHQRVREEYRQAALERGRRVNEFVLSRHAAEAAAIKILSQCNFPLNDLKSMVLDRTGLVETHGLHLSLAHESEVAAAVCWRRDPILPDQAFQCGIDVVDFYRMKHLLHRQKTFFPRWLGGSLEPCRPGVDSKQSIVRIGGITFLRELPASYHHQNLLATVSLEPAVVACILWGVRECFVKILEEANRHVLMTEVSGEIVLRDHEGSPANEHASKAQFNCTVAVGTLSTTGLLQARLEESGLRSRNLQVTAWRLPCGESTKSNEPGEAGTIVTLLRT